MGVESLVVQQLFILKNNFWGKKANIFKIREEAQSAYEYTRPNLYDAQFGYFGHLQMI
jgi:hypothetical protein